ncbi:MAG: amidohydrolase [Clostridiales bacterium]|jgi:predicted TIM-barrel fold metal-dependent hydrolase|nr:amidohydrolase [Clostridiales bacterium]
MNNKIGLEETFAIQETLGCSEKYFPKDVWPKFAAAITNLMDDRIKLMDENGMEIMILSLNAPAIQAIYNRKEAIETAKKANDTMAEAMQKYPKRFQGFAALPMQDPDAAILEAQRAVKELGCIGVLVNGYSQIDTEDNYLYLDDPIYRPFWAEIAKLNVPFYLHPREPMPCNSGSVDGHPWLNGAAWTFGTETATHALRLICSGLFDEFPNLKMILGHLGESLPWTMWRISNRMEREQRGAPIKLSVSDYLLRNFWYTTSGHHRTQTLVNVMSEVGADRILFATDFPFESVPEACDWFDNCSISENDRLKIGRTNAIKLFNLDLE